jgi:hypothetical protein
MFPDVPDTDASREGAFLASAVEWSGSLDEGAANEDGPCPSETQSPSSDSGTENLPSPKVLAVAEGLAAGQVVEAERAEPAERTEQQAEVPAEQVAAAGEFAVLVAAEIVESAEVMLESADRLGDHRAFSLLA